MQTNRNNPDLIVITGPTATGKTAFAANLAAMFDGEIISADSRQVYRGMDLATGKDINDYKVGDKTIPYHLVDIEDPGYEYSVFEFQQDFLNVYKDIKERKKTPVLCGGTGMYIESVLKGYKLINVPENKNLQKKLVNKSDHELKSLLKSFKVPHNVTDTKNRNRLIRAIEIQHFYSDNPSIDTSFPNINYTMFGLYFEREVIRKRITERLKSRLDSGMVDEVKDLLKKGLTPEQLKFYGLEYRYLTLYVSGEISYEEMYRLLNTAIHQFAKRQMTWFRRMEKQGFKIHWIDGSLSMSEKLRAASKVLPA
ncbi:MAG: tRNA (adenosine(37)-N6)-dimethylallyltransferase MiaA [Bacteroidales bacterium]